MKNGVHSYQSLPIDTTGGIGYFVGLVSVSMYANNFAGGVDEIFYDFTFQDQTYIENNGWDFSPGDLNTVDVLIGDLPVSCQSTVMKSTSSVVGVQFGTSQSDSIEIAYDDSFHSGALVGYDWLSTTMAHAVSDTNGTSEPSFDSTLQLSYNQNTYSVTVTRNYIPPSGPPVVQQDIVRREVAPVFDSVAPGTGTLPSEFSGLSSSWCSAAAEGTVWAAVRLTANTAMSSPLELQIVDAGNMGNGFVPTILATNIFTPNAGQTVTEQIGYILGSVTPAGNPIYVQVVQHGTAINNQFTVTQLSLFDDGMIWEFSNDNGATWYRAFGIRNNPQGMLSFPTGGTALKWQVIGTRTGVHVNSLRVRPVYQGVI